MSIITGIILTRLISDAIFKKNANPPARPHKSALALSSDVCNPDKFITGTSWLEMVRDTWHRCYKLSPKLRENWFCKGYTPLFTSVKWLPVKIYTLMILCFWNIYGMIAIYLAKLTFCMQVAVNIFWTNLHKKREFSTFLIIWVVHEHTRRIGALRLS